VSTATIVGVGNVAVDVARILISPVAALRHTEKPDYVLTALESSAIRSVHVVGRRGPAHASFTTNPRSGWRDLNPRPLDPRLLGTARCCRCTSFIPPLGQILHGTEVRKLLRNRGKCTTVSRACYATTWTRPRRRPRGDGAHR